ncbi:uncharacterized protein LOC143180375 [Calliopsis andreniformis]|uniref:uncharacterized protein LOC143180375 n=1 Tax=Calliopsis andreniformis TaxID=337506 RepID=UPI003FCEA001
MAGFLTKFGKRRYDCLISFLVIGPKELCDIVSEGLHQSAKTRKWHIVVHRCEFVTEVIKYNLNSDLDFIVFVFDWKTSCSMLEVQANIGLIDEHFIISGSVCLVNCKGASNIMGLNSHKLTKIRDKYNIRFLSANVSEPRDCTELSDSILNLTEAALGITSGIPVINF